LLLSHLDGHVTPGGAQGDSVRWRYLVSDDVGAAEGLAYDEATLWHYRSGAEAPLPATLRLYTYRAHCALVGRYQDLAQEVELAYCRENDVQTARRPTGGGAIIMGPGQLGLALAARAPQGEVPRETLKRYAQFVVGGLEELGISASFRSKNDLEVGGRKIAGLGLYRDDAGAMLFHASILVGLDTGLMLRVLRIPGAKFADKAVARVEERVTTVARELRGRTSAPAIGLTGEASEIRETFARGLARAAGVTLVPDALDGAEVSRQADLLRDRYGAEEWTQGRTVRGDAVGETLLKTPGGLLRIHVAVHGDVIKSAMVSGDFNALPSGIAELEASLRWCRADEDRVRQATAASLHEAELGVSAAAVSTAVWKATASALKKSTPAEPIYRSGSCYFPEPDAEVQAGSAGGSHNPGSHSMNAQATGSGESA
jgi:lipoate---protein ligase